MLEELPVITLHVPEVVAPTVSVAVTAVLALDAESTSRATVSFGEKIADVLPTIPLRTIAIHPLQSAARGPVNPVSVTVLLITVAF